MAGSERTIFSDVYTEIPSDYWKHSVINGLATSAAFEHHRHTAPEKTPYAWGPKGLHEPNCYTGLQLYLDDVLQLIGDLKGAGPLGNTSTSEKEEWITAANALALLAMNYFTGTRAICKRAHAGLVRAQARRFIRGGRAAENVEIPIEFWWAEGEAALQQNWTTGDFETWIDHRIHLQAFGVTFCRADIERAKPKAIADHFATESSISNKGHPVTLSEAVILKPTLWGMGIDLLMAWKWLRDGQHSLVPRFPKAASILSRLWRDPVWSKVIATSIIAVIMSLTGLIGSHWYLGSTPNGNHALLPTNTYPITVPPAIESRFHSQATQGNFCFDYSQNNGVYTVGNDDAIFNLEFSKASDTEIYLYSDGDKIARAKNVPKNDPVRFDKLDSTSRDYVIHTGEIFMARNGNGYYMQGRVLDIEDDTRGAKTDRVCVKFQIGKSGQVEFRAL